MSAKEVIVQAEAPVLRAVAKPVPKKDWGSLTLRNLAKKMSKALAAEEFGVALAAPQVGQSLRLFVIAGRAFTADLDEEVRENTPTPPDMVFVNPTIIRLSRKKKEMSEGCLSVRGKYGSVIRHEKASVKAQDLFGNTFTYHGTGLIAHIFQHECDHLEGVLYIDKAEKLRDEKKKEATPAENGK